jgi:hypothetical protein
VPAWAFAELDIRTMKKPREVVFQADYRSWRAHAAALLERGGVVNGPLEGEGTMKQIVRDVCAIVTSGGEGSNSSKRQ